MSFLTSPLFFFYFFLKFFEKIFQKFFQKLFFFKFHQNLNKDHRDRLFERVAIRLDLLLLHMARHLIRVFKQKVLDFSITVIDSSNLISVMKSTEKLIHP